MRGSKRIESGRVGNIFGDVLDLPNHTGPRVAGATSVSAAAEFANDEPSSVTVHDACVGSEHAEEERCGETWGVEQPVSESRAAALQLSRPPNRPVVTSSIATAGAQRRKGFFVAKGLS